MLGRGRKRRDEMKVKIKLSMETLSSRHEFDDLADKYQVDCKMFYENGVWVYVSGDDNQVMQLMCDLCNNLVAA
jgi:hypothetical protein